MRGFTLILVFLFSDASGASTDASREEEIFIRQSIDLIHGRLRFAVKMNSYYVACLEDDKRWFENLPNKFESEDRYTRCFRDDGEVMEGVIDNIKAKIGEKYPLMIRYLIIYHYHAATRTPGHWETKEGQTERERFGDIARYDLWVKSNRAHRFVQHLFPSLAVLPPMSSEQFEDARRAILSEEHCREEEDEPEKMYGKKEKESLSDCYEKLYKTLLAGEDDSGREGFPILGFVTSPHPDNGELADAIKSLNDNTKKLLNNFREAKYVFEDGEYHLKVKNIPFSRNYFFKPNYFSLEYHKDIFDFSGMLKYSIARDSDRYQELYDKGFALWESAEMNRLWMEMGVLVTWGVACVAIFKNPAAQRWCFLPTGIGANVYFLAVDNAKYQEALDIALYRAEGYSSSWQSLDRLDELSLARTISIITFPFFTEIPGLFKKSLPSLQKVR